MSADMNQPGQLKILFVCGRNNRRSPTAERIFQNDSRMSVRSAGIADTSKRRLTREDLVRILTEPSGSLTRQYTDLLSVDNVSLEFTIDGIDQLASVAFQVNQSTQNIGARRLQTIMERLLEEISFEAPDCGPRTIVVDAEFVRQRLDDVCRDEDLSRFVL